MLRKYAVFFSAGQTVADIITIAVSWIAAYVVRFHSGLFSSPKGIPPFDKHLYLTLVIVFLCYLACTWAGAYRPKRLDSFFNQFILAFRSSVISVLLISAVLYFSYNEMYSRKLLVVFFVILFLNLALSRFVMTGVLRWLRRRRYNLRYYAVIGTDKKGQQLVRDIERMGWLGLKCAFFIDSDPKRIGTELLGVPVKGPVEKLTELVKAETIDEVYLALSGNQAQEAYPILEALQSVGTTIRIIPDWGSLVSTSNATAVTIGSQVLFSAAESALNGANIVLKELFDRVVSVILLVILFVPMGLVAVLIKLTSRGPVFYKQRRVGMDQKEFQILKFRTMRVDAEEEGEPQWTKESDPRCTSVGAWLRRTSLDELPQLINVVQGQMSLVGPRPERPYFVKQFSEEYKKYMLRHKVKAGITGWAQINGLRGDSSLRKRLVYDLYYVRNWSFVLDVWIFLRTPLHIIKGKNAY